MLFAPTENNSYSQTQSIPRPRQPSQQRRRRRGDLTVENKPSTPGQAGASEAEVGSRRPPDEDRGRSRGGEVQRAPVHRRHQHRRGHQEAERQRDHPVLPDGHHERPRSNRLPCQGRRHDEGSTGTSTSPHDARGELAPAHLERRLQGSDGRHRGPPTSTTTGDGRLL